MGTKYDAIYNEQGLSEYRDNPLIEALPKILTTQEVVQKLSKTVHYDISEKEAPFEQRLHCITRIAREYYLPWEQHIDLEQRISQCIRQGYIGRNPFQNSYTKVFYEGYNAQMNKSVYSLEEYHSQIPGFTILGVSGIGKSMAVERILSLYPQVIRHTEYKGKQFNHEQLVWLKIDCSYNGNIKGLCYDFLKAIDKALDTNYYYEYHRMPMSENSLMTLMERIAAIYSLGILVIDEIQHLIEAGKDSDKMLNFFVTLTNTISLPVILIGTPAALPILQKEFRQARRSSGRGDFTWSMMSKDKAWNSFIQKMWPYQWIRNFVPLTQEINDVLYDESQGITVIAVLIYEIAQLEAIRNEKEIFTAQDMRRWARKRLSFIQPMLNVLRAGKPELIDKFSDLVIAVVEECSIPEIAEELRKKSYPPVEDIVTIRLQDFGVLPEKARIYAEKACRIYKKDINAALTMAFKMHLKEQDNLSLLEHETDEDDLRNSIK